MKKMTRFAAGVLSALMSTTTFADKAAYDGFEKADLGALDGQVGGTGFSGAYSANASMKVIERSLVYENGSLKIDGGKQALQMKRSTVANENLLGSRPLAESHAEDVFYVSALFYIDKNTKSNNNRDTYWVGLSPDSATRPAGGLGVEDTSYKWGGIIGGQGRLAAVVETDKPHFIVAKIHKNTKGAANKYDRVSLMVDPESADEPETWTMENQGPGSSTTYSELAYLNFFMQYDRAETVDTVIVDEIRVGTTWSDVVVPYEEKPDASSIVHWTGGAGGALDWTVPANWEENVSASGADVVFGQAGTGDATTVGNSVAADLMVNSLEYRHFSDANGEALHHVTSVAEGATLTVEGTNAVGRAFDVASVPQNAQAYVETHATLTGGGALNVSSPDGKVIVGGGTVEPDSSHVRGFVDLSGLSSFKADVDRLVLGEARNTRGEMYLATAGEGVNEIRANYVGIGDSAGILGGPETSVMKLGKSNVIHADRINVAATEVSGTKRNNGASGSLSFAAGLENPTLTVRSQGGTRRADMTVASHGDGGNNWYAITGRADFSGGRIDMLLGELLIAAGVGYNGTQRGSVDGYFTMDAGQVDVNKLSVGRTCLFDGGRKADTYPAWGRYTMRGGETIVNEAVEVGVSTNGAWRGGIQCVKGDIMLSGDARFTALGSVVLASDQGYTTSAVARVSIEDRAVFTACRGISNGLRLEDKSESWGDIKIAEFDGSVFVNGGLLAVTNSTGTSELKLDYGTLDVNGGRVIADRLTMTGPESVVKVKISSREPAVVVKGAANVDGAKLVVTVDDGYVLERTGSYKLIQAAAASGTFADIEAPRGMRIRNTANGIVGSFGGLVIVVQ